MSTFSPASAKRITTHQLQGMKKQKQKITMLTAYDYSMAHLLDEAGVDVLLVGDSASNVMAGHETTLPITLDEMIYHAKCVVRAAKRALVVVDIPFGFYQEDAVQAVRSAIRIMKESGAHAVKLEGGEEMKQSIEKILKAGIPVMGHLGLMPQSIYKFGTYSVRGQSTDEAQCLLKDASLLSDCGCFSIVLEKIPAYLAAKIAQTLTVPVIGIGAGAEVDGQVLVSYDMLGITQDFNPRFLKRYAQLSQVITQAVSTYVHEVQHGIFPSEKESY